MHSKNQHWRRFGRLTPNGACKVSLDVRQLARPTACCGGLWLTSTWTSSHTPPHAPASFLPLSTCFYPLRSTKPTLRSSALAIRPSARRLCDAMKLNFRLPAMQCSTLGEVIRLFDAGVDLPPTQAQPADCDATRDFQGDSTSRRVKKLGVISVTQR